MTSGSTSWNVGYRLFNSGGNRVSSRTWSGSDTPNWSSRRFQLGERSMSNSYSSVRENHRPPYPVPIFMKYRAYNRITGVLLYDDMTYFDRAAGVSHATSVIPGLSLPSAPSYASLQNEVRGRFYQKLADSMRVLQSLVSIGESKETARYIHDRLNPVYKHSKSYVQAVKEAASRKFKRIRDIVDFAGDRWLEYRLAVIPLLADAEAVTSAFGKRSYYILVMANGDLDIRPSNPEISYSGSQNYIKTTVRGKVTQKARVVCKGLVKADSSNQDFATRWGLTASDWLPSLVELVPWSFVAGYFLNFQDVLNAAVVRKTNVVYSCESTIVSSEGRYIQAFETDLPQPPSVRFVELDSSYPVPREGSLSRTSINRIPGVSLPSLQLAMPGWKQTVTIAALLNSLFQNRGTKR